MLVVGVFIGAYISSTLSGDHDAGEVTLPELTGTSPWLWILGLTAAAAAIGLTRKSGLSSPASANHAQHTS
jgi:hypothetical protein